MRITVRFWSYFKELTGCSDVAMEVSDAMPLGQLLADLHSRFPKLAPMAKSTLVAVGVEYQPKEFVLKDGDEVSLFPPVQGG